MPNVEKTQAAVVNVGVPGQMIQEGSPFGFQLPETMVAPDLKAESISVARVDGGEMPSWLTFDAQPRTFVSERVPAGALPLKLLVVVDGKATEVVISERD